MKQENQKIRFWKHFGIVFASLLVILGTGITAHAEQVKIYGSKEVTVGVGRKVATNYASNPAGAKLTYKVEDPTLASVDTNGIVTGLKVGTTKLIIHAPAVGSYTARTGAVPLNIRKPQTIKTSANSYATSVNGKVKITASSGSSRTYSSSNTKIAKVDSTGVITGVSSGTAVITIKAKATKKYLPAQKQVNVVVSRANQTVSVSPVSLTMTPGSTKTLTVSSKTSRTFTSSNTAVATVDASGKITARGSGKAVITVNAKGTSKYKAASAKVNVTVQPASAAAYTKLKNIIQASSKRNSSGDHFISGTMSSNGVNYTYGIVYSAARDKFQFVYDAKGDTRDAVNMVLNNPNTISAKPQVTYVDMNNNGSFKAEATLNMATYTGTRKLNVTLTAVSGNAKNYLDQNREAASNFINNAFSFWNAFLKSNAGITIKDLGFAAYVGK